MSKVPYSSIVSNLMYAMVCTRLDIAHAMGVVRRYMNNLGKEHWMEVKWIPRYLEVLLHMHYVLEVQALFYKDMFIYIWWVIRIVGEEPKGIFLLWVEQK
jgi:ABC-type protease/lipase transport system fused ATPase/permease subunit